jgi:uncharacterized membrane protein YccC
MEVAASLKEARLPKGFERVCDQMRVALRAIRVRRGPWTTEEATKATLTDALQRRESLTGQLHGVVRIADVLARVDPSALSEIGLPGALISRKAAVRSRINTDWLRDRAATLRANMTFASQACRHAIRLAVAVAVAIELSRLVGFRHDYWVPLSVVIVLQPDLGATFSRGVRRIAGTLVGVGVVTVVLAELHPGCAGLTVLALCCISWPFLPFHRLRDL